MRKIELQFLFCLALFLGFNFMLPPAKASLVLDQDYNGYGSVINWSDGWRVIGQQFIPAHNNISRIVINGNGYLNTGVAQKISVCQGIPPLPDDNQKTNVENNAPTCNFSGNTLLWTGDLYPQAGDYNQFYDLPSPVGLTVGENYYFVVKYYSEPTGSLLASFHAETNGHGILNGSSFWATARFMYRTYYESTYTPPPPTPTFQINLLTPSPNAPYTTYYGQPASYTFNYIDPLHWYPQIRFMIKRKADAKASAWPDYINSATFWTSATATSTLTYGTAIFQLPDGYYDLRVDYWANIPQMLGLASTTFTIDSGGSYGGYSFATSTLIKPPTFSTSDLCGDIATTTTFGAIECGLIKAFVNTITWAFAPSFDTLQNFKVSYELWKGCFPFNTYFQLTDTITNAASSTATSTSGTIKIPFIHTITGGGTFYMLDAISSSTLSNWIGGSNYNLFRTTIGYFFWLIACAVVFFTIKFI